MLQLRAVWAALDTDGSGYIAAGEWGRFMKLGEQHLRQEARKAGKGLSWKERSIA